MRIKRKFLFLYLISIGFNLRNIDYFRFPYNLICFSFVEYETFLLNGWASIIFTNCSWKLFFFLEYNIIFNFKNNFDNFILFYFIEN